MKNEISNKSEYHIAPLLSSVKVQGWFVASVFFSEFQPERTEYIVRRSPENTSVNTI